MSTKVKVGLITLLFGIPTFFLGPMLWPINPMNPAPTPGQLPFFIILSILESLVFGLGIAFMIYGWPTVQKIADKSKQLALWTYVAISWGLVSWWPHDHLHGANGMDMEGLLYIEYGFHVTLMVAALVLAYAFLKLLYKKA